MAWSGLYRWMSHTNGSTGVADKNCGYEHRYALLLRPTMAQSLEDDDIGRLYGELDSEMGAVAAGVVQLRTGQAYGNSAFSDEMHWTVEVGDFFIDRYAVTNQQYLQFVDGGGYEEESWWDEAAIPLLDQWVDRTGVPGPMNWCQGQPSRDQWNHPVVGVSWYEASAYARWVGKRLPSEAEWMRSGVGDDPVGRQYPWGIEWNNDLANTWQAGFDRTVPVDSILAADNCVIQQLIGNVWEWTQTAFGCWSGAAEWRNCDGFRAIKGGAFDTLLAAQASIRFQSGDAPHARRANIGFRCALNPSDLVVRPAQSEMSGERNERRAK